MKLGKGVNESSTSLHLTSFLSWRVSDDVACSFRDVRVFRRERYGPIHVLVRNRNDQIPLTLSQSFSRLARDSIIHFRLRKNRKSFFARGKRHHYLTFPVDSSHSAALPNCASHTWRVQ